MVDRFGQIAPRMLFGVDGYFFNGKRYDTLSRLSEVVARIPSVERVIVVPYASPSLELGAAPNTVLWQDFVAGLAPAPIPFEPLPFDHPLFVMYSSGTTGPPKCIVHGHGGTLLQHLKEHRLHSDLRPGGRLMYFTHLRLDDVELDGVRARVRSHPAALRRLADLARRRRALRLCASDRNDALRYFGQVPGRDPQVGSSPRGPL